MKILRKIRAALRVNLSEALDRRPVDPMLEDDGEPGVFQDFAGIRARLGDFEPGGGR